MSETPVEDVTTPTRKANARSAEIVNRIVAPPSRKRACTTCVFQMMMSQIDPIRYSRLAAASSIPPQ